MNYLSIIPWVEGEDFFAEASAVNVNVNFGGGNAFVSEHLLNGSQVGSTFKQVCGKGVSQGVWTNFFANACQFGKLLDDIENHHTCQSPSSTIEK